MFVRKPAAADHVPLSISKTVDGDIDTGGKAGEAGLRSSPEVENTSGQLIKIDSRFQKWTATVDWLVQYPSCNYRGSLSLCIQPASFRQYL